MYNKVMVAEDIDSINIGVISLLQQLKIKEINHAAYCDEAFLKAKRALQDNEPYELLICDLSFKVDHRDEKITSGQDLIAALKKEQPDLKVIVYSIEDHPQTVQSLWESVLINGYVCKDRKGLLELEDAINEVFNNNSYLSPQLEPIFTKKNVLTLGDFEIRVLTDLANGLTQDEIEQRLKSARIIPSSRSSIEKRIKELKEEFQANTTIHLVTILKDLRLI
ncbi:DNA-binding response regulator [Sediminicola arcticus]|uniref:DNA-binding response regulator n=1 Tax=Sediminicola arcticus TaxID=1574308 RepID=A0ABV2SPR9_9FLAO